MSTQSLAAYLPIDRYQALARGSDLPDHSSGAALFADISGFTPLTNSLVRELGPQRGAEEISRQLNRIYTALVAEVHHYHGSVLGFAGDAITCWFDDSDDRRPTTDDRLAIDSSVRPLSAADRAVACSLAMQRRMGEFADVRTPAGTSVALAMKVSVTAGPVRRFVVGDPEIQLIDALAGDTIYRLATADKITARGEVVVSSEAVAAMSRPPRIAEWRVAEDEPGRFALVLGMEPGAKPDPWPEIDYSQIDAEKLRSWLLPPIYARLQAGHGQFLAELRPAVAMFVRFAGIDYDNDEDAGIKLDAYLRWAQRIVSRFDGSLLQLTIGDKGSYFYCVFGAPQAHQDDAVRAARAALQLRTPPSELNFISNTQIGISQGRMRTGAYGSNTRLTYSAIGDEVNMAARLMQAAGPGQVFASAGIQLSTAASFNWDELPPLMVKGRSEPLSAYCLLSTRDRQPLHFQNAIYGLPMVGRGAELGNIRALMKEAIGGKGHIVAITGEAGLGKSRLVVECLRMAVDLGMTIYSGEAQSYGTNDSYLAWESIWQEIFALDRADAIETTIARIEQMLGEISPDLLPRMPLLSVVLNLPIPENELTRSLESRLRKLSLESLLVTCLRNHSRGNPLLLVIEDAHWLDPLSHDLLETIGWAIADMPVLIVIAYRPPEAEYLRAPRVTALPHCSVIGLSELTPVEAADLIALKLVHLDMPAVFSAEVIERLVDRTQGNPFYIEELLNYLHGRNLAPRTARELEELDLPTSLYSLILSRIDQLSEHQKTTLKVASVIGRLFEAAWLWGVHPELGSPLQVFADLAVLNRMELTLIDQPEPDAVYLFKHILTHGVAYESLPFETRAWLHEQVARFIEQHYAPVLDQFVDLLAFHYDRSPNEAKKREYLWRAGKAAQAAYANMAAIDYYRRLLALLPEDEQGPVQLRLGQVLELVGEWAAAREMYEQALAHAEANDPRAAVEARRAIGNLARKQSEYVDALRWLELARAGYAALGEQAGLVQTLADIGEVHRLLGDYGQAGRCYQEGLDLAATAERSPELLAALANALKGAGTLANQHGEPQRSQALYAESLAIRRELNDKPGIAVMLNNQGVAALFREDFTRAEPLFAESLALFRQLGDRWAVGQLLNNLGMVMRSTGQPAKAKSLLEESVAVRRSLGDKWGIANALSSLANLLLHEGEHHELPALLRESLDLNLEAGDRTAIAYCLEDYAGLAAARGSHESALYLAGAASALRAELGAPLPPGEQAALDRLLQPSRAALGEAEQAVFVRGKTMSQGEAVILAVTP